MGLTARLAGCSWPGAAAGNCSPCSLLRKRLPSLERGGWHVTRWGRALTLGQGLSLNGGEAELGDEDAQLCLADLANIGEVVEEGSRAVAAGPTSTLQIVVLQTPLLASRKW